MMTNLDTGDPMLKSKFTRLAEFLTTTEKRPAGETRHFVALRTDLERLRFCTTLMRNDRIHPKHVRSVFGYEPRLDVIQPAIVRLMRMAERQTSRKPREAFVLINKCIAMSARVPGAHNLHYRALLCRAALYYDMNAFRPCRDSVDLAFELPDTDNTYLEQTLRMRYRCERNIVRHPERLKRTEPLLRHDAFEFARDFDRQRLGFEQSAFDAGMQLRRTADGLGHMVRFNRNIAAGQVIGIDRALFPSLVASDDWMRCAFCLRENLFELMACTSTDNCCLTMFCSEECRTEALQSWHAEECGIDKFLQAYPQCRPIVRLVLNTFRSAEGVREMHEFVQTSARTSPDQFSVYAYAQMRRLPANYKAKLAYTMDTRRRLHTDEEAFHSCRLAAYVYKVFKYRTTLMRRLFRTKELRNFLRTFIHQQVLVLHEHGRVQLMVSSVRLPTEPSVRMRPMAYGLYPLSASLAHNCRPNVAAFSCGPNEMALCTVRAIRADEELTIDKSHGHNRMGHTRTLAGKYKVACNCPTQLESAGPAELAEPPWPMYGEVITSLCARRTPRVAEYFGDICRYLSANQPKWSLTWQVRTNRLCFNACIERLLLGPYMQYDWASDKWYEMRRRNADEEENATAAVDDGPPKERLSERDLFRQRKKEMRFKGWKTAVGSIGNLDVVGKKKAKKLAMLERSRTLPMDGEQLLQSVEMLPIHVSLIYSNRSGKSELTPELSANSLESGSAASSGTVR